MQSIILGNKYLIENFGLKTVVKDFIFTFFTPL